MRTIPYLLSFAKPPLAYKFVKKLTLCISEKVPFRLGVYNAGALNVLSLDKSKDYRRIFLTIIKGYLPTQLAHLRFLLCQVLAFFLTLLLVYLVRLLEFSLWGYD